MSAVPQAPGDAPGRPASRGSGSGSRGTSPRGDGEPRAKRESRGSGFMATLARVKAPSLPMRLGDWAGAKQGEPPSVIAVNSSSNSKDSVPTDNLAGLGIVDASDGPLSPAVMPRLTYFNARGRAEVVRIMCAEAAFQYEDYRFRPNLENECRAPGQHDTTQRQCLCQTHGPGNDEFVEFRASGKSITGQVPLMEVDGLSICQTSAICRYLARKFGMAGSNPAEMAHVDMVASSIDDLYIFMVQSMIERKVDLDFYVGQWPMVGKTLEKMAQSFSPIEGYFVAGHLTWVDIYGFHMFTRLEEGHSGVLDAFPRLRAIVDNVAQRPRVRTWLSTRVKREQALGNYIDWLL